MLAVSPPASTVSRCSLRGTAFERVSEISVGVAFLVKRAHYLPQGHTEKFGRWKPEISVSMHTLALGPKAFYQELTHNPSVRAFSHFLQMGTMASLPEVRQTGGGQSDERVQEEYNAYCSHTGGRDTQGDPDVPAGQRAAPATYFVKPS